MFWRIFLTYLSFVALAVVLVGGVVWYRTRDLFWAVAPDGAVALGIVAAIVIPIAFLLAAHFTRPILELTFGARRLADGDFGPAIHVGGSQEAAALAQTFNAMSARLAASFTQVEHDRQQLRTILSGMIEGVVAYDATLRVLFANDRAAELLDVPADQIVGRKLWEVTRQRGVQELAEKALLGGDPHRGELDWHGPAVKTLAVYASRLPGHASGAVMVLHDITELRRLERLRQDFVANVSHELKTPLTNILSHVEVLLDGAADDPALRDQFLAEIDDQAHRLHALVSDLLSIARMESGENLLEFEVVRVDDAVQACLDRHRTRAEAKGLALNAVALGATPSDLSVWADEDGLSQILDNLVDNAIKYTPNGGRVTVRWSAEAEQVILEIEDTGAGIPERDQPRVFERFYRVDKARSRAMGGTGLGLAIVKHLTQAMKGTVGVASIVGQGSTFRVGLPRAVNSVV